MGKWFKRIGKRDQIFLTTKFGFVKDAKPLETDSSYAYCKKACDESLKALSINTIDLCEYIFSLQTRRKEWDTLCEQRTILL